MVNVSIPQNCSQIFRTFLTMTNSEPEYVIPPAIAEEFANTFEVRETSHFHEPQATSYTVLILL